MRPQFPDLKVKEAGHLQVEAKTYPFGVSTPQGRAYSPTSSIARG